MARVEEFLYLLGHSLGDVVAVYTRPFFLALLLL
jgi:hypothetical protein